MFVVILIILTCIQLFIHFYEYGLLFKRSVRSTQFMHRARLPSIVLWESVYYFLVCLWFLHLALTHQTKPSTLVVMGITSFAMVHVVGCFLLRQFKNQLDSAVKNISLLSSVVELVTLLQDNFRLQTSRAYRQILIGILGIDAIEIFFLLALLFQLLHQLLHDLTLTKLMTA